MAEGDTQVVLQTDGPPASGLLFALSPGPATRTTPVLIGGGTGGFAELSAVYELVRSLTLQPALIVPEKIASALPASAGAIMLPDQAAQLRSAEAWNRIDSAGVVIMGLDMHPTSTQQIVLSRLMRSSRTPMLVTDELASMFRIEPELLAESHILPFFSLSSIRSQALGLQVPVRLVTERGVYGVADLLKSMDCSSPLVIAYDAERLYSYIRETDCLIHTPIPANTPVARLRRLLIASLLLTYCARGQSASTTELIQAAHYFIYTLIGQTENGPRADAAAVRSLLEQD